MTVNCYSVHLKKICHDQVKINGGIFYSAKIQTRQTLIS